jgi:hypothetical protein
VSALAALAFACASLATLLTIHVAVIDRDRASLWFYLMTLATAIIVFLAVQALLSRPAHAETFVRCSSAGVISLGGDDPHSFVEEKSDAARWLADMRKGGDRTVKCVPLSNRPTYSLLVVTEGGDVRVSRGLTENECEETKYRLTYHAPGTTYTVMPTSIKYAECRR